MAAGAAFYDWAADDGLDPIITLSRVEAAAVLSALERARPRDPFPAQVDEAIHVIRVQLRGR